MICSSVSLTHRQLPALAVVSLLAACTGFLGAQADTPAGVVRQGKVERVKVHGKALEGNLEGDSPDRDVSVYLPPGYASDRARRYPVVYMLHGYTDDDSKWFGLERHWISLPAVVNQTLGRPSTREMIYVMPNAFTRFQGSMYSSSVTTGDWETFVARDLVAYVDSHYRTIPEPAARGLAGHSMGGYGTMRIGMKHPDVFSSIYLLSACCLAPGMLTDFSPAAIARVEAVKTLPDFEKAEFMTKIVFASAAAWSPNPKKPPFFLDLPIEGGKPQPAVRAKWTASAPLAMLDQYVPNLKRLHAIGFDAGTRDQPIAGTTKTLDEVLTTYGIAHTFEIYQGTHVDRIAERIETKMVPFFSTNLTFDQPRAK